MRAAWFHCFSGVAGDMALGSLVDAGADFDQVLAMLDRLPVRDWSATAEPVLRGGIAGTKVHVHAHDSTVVRTAAHIQGLVAEARLPNRVQQRAQAVFSALAVAEGRLHARPPDQVHFHEVGGIDAIVDVVGTCIALELLGVDEISCSPISVGLGMVRSAHGVIPNPAPAVVELLRGIPTRGLDLSLELTTPTGAALMAALAGSFGAVPAMTVERSGFGAGSRELDHRPNLTQVVIGEAAEDSTLGRVEGQPVVQLEVNVDDATGEVLAHTLARLLEAGAHDAWITPIVMKKGRPAHTVHALCDPVEVAQVAEVLRAETGSLGVRAHRIERWPGSRRLHEVTVDELAVRVKVSPGRVKVEFDDAAEVSRRTGRPVRDVLAEAEARWHMTQSGDSESSDEGRQVPEADQTGGAGDTTGEADPESATTATVSDIHEGHTHPHHPTGHHHPSEPDDPPG